MVSRANTDKADLSFSGRRPRTARGEHKRRLILEAAGDLLAANGYAATSLADIAEAADTFAGSLYYHFESREALAVEVLTSGIDAAFEHNRAALAAAPSDASSRDRLGVALSAHVSFILEDNTAALAAFRSFAHLPPKVAEPVGEAHRRYLDHFAELFDAAAADGVFDESVSPTAVRMLVTGIAVSAVEWLEREDGSSPEEIGQLLQMMLFDGLGSRSPRG